MWTAEQFQGPTVEETFACLAIGALASDACRDFVDQIGIGRRIAMLFRHDWEIRLAEVVIEGLAFSEDCPWWVPFLFKDGMNRGVDSWETGRDNAGVRCLLHLAAMRSCHIVSTQLTWLAERTRAGENLDEAVEETRGWLELLSPSR